MARKPRKLGFFNGKMKSIKQFFFDKAKYRVGDKVGNEVFLAIDYKNDAFRIGVIRRRDDGLSRLKRDVAVVARDLLSRKHNINFAKKFK